MDATTAWEVTQEGGLIGFMFTTIVVLVGFAIYSIREQKAARKDLLETSVAYAKLAEGVKITLQQLLDRTPPA